MTQTPETDDAAFHIDGRAETFVDSSFARKLECDRTSLKLQLEISEAQRFKSDELYTILANKYEALYQTHTTYIARLHELSKVQR